MYFVTASSEAIALQPLGHPTAGATHLGNPIKSPVRSAGDFLLTSSGLRGCHWRGMTSQF
jgi:hypothetical protein